MKKLLLALAIVSVAACSTLKGDPAITPIEPFADLGNPDAIICTTRGDAAQFVTYAGNKQGAEFRKFFMSARKADRCMFMNNDDPITVRGYESVVTANGVLFIVEFEQNGKLFYSSSNYFDTAGPMSLIWERQLTEARQ